MHARQYFLFSIAVVVLILPALALLTGMAAAQRTVSETRAAPHAHSRLRGLPPIRGFCIQLADPNGTAAYERSVKRLRQMGCHWINFVVNARQHDVKSSHLAMDRRYSLKPKDIVRVLDYAHRLGIRTMLMPIVLLNHATGDEWRGVIHPPNWNVWFADYRRYIRRCARWSARCHVQIFSVGSELLSTERYRSRWRRVIRTVRKVYNGKLTYSANWDHYLNVRIWPWLNYIGMNSYYDLANDPHTPVDGIRRSWRSIKSRILAFARYMHKPVLLTEIGWDNLQNTLAKPWDYVGTGKINPAVQQRAFAAFIDEWRHIPRNLFAGAMIWQWQPGAKPTDYGTYSLQGEPALPLVANWIAGR